MFLVIACPINRGTLPADRKIKTHPRVLKSFSKKGRWTIIRKDWNRFWLKWFGGKRQPKTWWFHHSGKATELNHLGRKLQLISMNLIEIDLLVQILQCYVDLNEKIRLKITLSPFYRKSMQVKDSGFGNKCWGFDPYRELLWIYLENSDSCFSAKKPFLRCKKPTRRDIFYQ